MKKKKSEVNFEEITLSPELEEIAILNFYEYIRTKAIAFLQKGPDEYGKNDALGRPQKMMKPELLKLINEGCMQIVKYRGLTAETAFENLGINAFYEIMALFHFRIITQKIAVTTGEYFIDEMHVKHIVVHHKMILYNRVEKRYADYAFHWNDLNNTNI